MKRRDFLRSVGAVSASLALSKPDHLLADGTPSDNWRTFEVKTRVEVPNAAGATRVWLPAGVLSETAFQKTLSNDFSAEGGKAQIVRNRADGLGIVSAEFPAGA